MTLAERVKALSNRKRTLVLAQCQETTDAELERQYCESLDEAYPDCMIAGLSYQTSRALKEIDPTAYRVGLSDWIDSDESLVEIDGAYYNERDLELAMGDD